MTITTRIYTFFCGRLVGEDPFGNRYYSHKGAAHGSKTDKRKRAKRWVIYNGLAEPSKVPAQWHGWLHYTSDIVPKGNPAHHPWEKASLPNLTGTKGAYLPQGHLLRTAHHAPATADYEAWKP